MRRLVRTDRQSSPTTCRASVMGMVLTLGVLAAQPAGAEVEVTVVAEVDTIAPALVVLTASVASDDPVIAFDWGTLATPMRCRQSSCSLDVPIASCHRVSAEVTTLFGDVAEDTASFCVEDDGRPPRAELSVVDDGAKWSVGVTSSRGTDRVVDTKFWIDERGPFTEAEVIVVDRDGHCHALDALAIDRQGRVGFDRRELCTSPDAPRAWVAPDLFCPPVGTPRTTCVEVDHPLHLAVETSSSSAFLSDECRTKPAPPMLERSVFSASDDRGQRVYASTFDCGAARGGRLFFMRLPSELETAELRSVRLEPTLYGGVGPFDVRVDAPYAFTVTTNSRDEPTIVIASLPIDAPKFDVFVQLTDSNGLVASSTTSVTVLPFSVASPDSASGCAAVPARVSWWWAFVLAAILLRRRSA